MERTFDVAALGEAMLEFNQTRPGEPHYLQGFGGDTSNAAIAAARAGARTAYLTRIGDDAFGQRLMQLWAAERVDTRAVECDSAAPTAIYFVTHGAQGHEFSYLRAGSAASRMTPAMVGASAHPAPAEAPAADVIRHSRFLHVSGISLAISSSACDTAFAAMRLAREAGNRVAFDSNLRLKLWPLDRARACILQAMALSDVFLPSADDVTPLTGLTDPDAMVDWAHASGCATVALKLGSAGVLVSQGGQRRRLAPHHVQVVDATGAGDCFAGNLLARLAAGDDVFEAARYANAAAAIKVQDFGAVAPLPRPAQVKALL
jgi:2-dehydro-3-deoxygluconokinase